MDPIDTDGIKKVYDYIILKAGETSGRLDEIDVSYIMGALNMWLIDHELTDQELIDVNGAQYPPGDKPGLLSIFERNKK